jgi:DNA-binding HxlR family transcriptional regulator
MTTLVERHAAKIAGVLGCYDRIVIQGTLPGLCYAEGMAAYLRGHKIRLFDYARFAEPLRDDLRENAEKLAKDAGVEIEFMRKTTMRKDERIAQVLAKRGWAPGLVHILSAMEACPSYRPWHDKKTGKTFLKPQLGKCLHYYFYFIDAELGLCYVRVPTWAPFRLQFYFNGHNQLAAKLRAAGIEHRMLDNAFVHVADLDAAQRLADDIDIARLHAALDRYATLCCPVLTTLQLRYHWTLMQVEYSTDIVFRRQADLGPIYDTISRTAIHAVKPDNVATFLGRKLTGNYQDEMGNSFSTRIEGTRIKHVMGRASIKMYDKRGLILRIETTANDVSFFKHHRKVEQKNGECVYRIAPLKKSIYSLADLRGLMADANRRYLAFISALEDPSVGVGSLRKVAEPAVDESGRNHRGFNFFSADDDRVLAAIVRGEFTVSGLRNKDLRAHIPGSKAGWVSRCLKRLRVHGLIKRVGKTYKYYLTELGRRVILTGLKLRQMVVVPALAKPSTQRGEAGTKEVGSVLLDD